MFVSQVLEWIEYFAGAAEVSKHVRACGYKSRCFDISYPFAYKSQNYMDLLTPAGMASEAQTIKISIIDFPPFCLPGGECVFSG